ncbi:zinc-ribbon domain-containing protein [Haloarcula sp. S1CR25-12]|uniref:RING-type E3 ubiquitin transferase n=1 Tax=Haloarcula saliterrae TaxID=2950534 RepID=A0ABU2FHW3_9EURY|nr:zinc-ribbon domain-containing protein [Haloarcula sp. S1CR25-12]MDS0261855.1 zinc-ribbon domain-containing protein [Haloarcula sp. S1CR25-12]
MTHNTPDGTCERRLWCNHCQLSVAASTDDGEPTCPACGSEFRE